MKDKILAIFNLILLSTIISGLAYSHWQDTVQIQGTIKMGHRKLIIESEKLLVPTGIGFNETHPIYYHVTLDKQSFIAECQNVDYNWTIAIGLILKNEGTLPLTLKETQITLNIPDTSNFTITTYYCGPFPPGTSFIPYWDGISLDQLLARPDGYKDPIPLDPDDRAITWTIINHNGTQPLNMTLTATPLDDPYP